MKEVIIKKGIPIPSQKNRQNKYPWNEMEVGDCFEHDASAKTAYAHSSQHNVNGKLFKCALLDGKPHVWRIK